jgi:hypothetical protein
VTASDIDIASLPAPAQKALAPEAPGPLKTMAARGVIPGLKPGEIVTVVAALARGADPALAETARATLAKLPPPMLAGALSSDLPGGAIESLVEALPGRHDVIEQLLRMPRITARALELMAERADERAGELIATHE